MRTPRHLLIYAGAVAVIAAGVLTWAGARWFIILVAGALATNLVFELASAGHRMARRAAGRRFDATHDRLTGVANRQLFDRELGQMVDRAVAGGRSMALVLVDLDRFKSTNDRLGNQIGDQVLVEVARRLRRGCRPEDRVARLGGDEFAVILPGLDAASAAETVRRILDRFNAAVDIEGVPVALRATAGVAVVPDHGQDPQTLLRRADEALDSAKRADHTVQLYRPTHGRTAVGRLGLLNDLAAALETEELFLEYQPQVAMGDGRPMGAEALIRWRHPEVGLVPPGAFMPLAEQTDLIGPLTERVLADALDQAAVWKQAGRNLSVAVNVSVRNLEHPGFPDLVERQLSRTGVAPAELLLEITENTTALERTTVRSGIHLLRELGTSVAIDDFGTGYSSIVALRELPFDQIKLDRQFVHRMADDARDALIVRAIIQLANALAVETVAEGVEDELVATLLRDLGCQQAQGFLFAQPMGADDFNRWLDRRNRWSAPLLEPEPGAMAAPGLAAGPAVPQRPRR